MTMTDREPWQINTERMAEEIRRGCAGSRTEEDVKMCVERVLRPAFERIGLDIAAVQYERRARFGASRRDAVYGFITIEYEAPGKLGSRTGLRHSLGQLRQYMDEDAAVLGSDHEAALEKLIGVAIDGERIAFVRYSRSVQRVNLPLPIQGLEQSLLFPKLRTSSRGFVELGPYPINSVTLENLLIFARAAHRKPLTAAGLAEAFGPGHDIAHQALSVLYGAAIRIARHATSSKPKRFFKEWDRLFGVVYGQEIGRAQRAAAETAQAYRLPGGADLKPLLFAIHTYYAFLMKLIAVELLSLQPGSDLRGFAAEIGALEDAELHRRLALLESGAEFSNRGIVNFLEADFFGWYLDLWSPSIAQTFRGIALQLADFEPATPRLEPRWTQDLLRTLYEIIVPQKLRHDLGEYYTPDWLATHLLDRAGYKGQPDRRVLDPACGSGTFLVHAIRRAVDRAQRGRGRDLGSVGEAVLQGIVGFDLNPMAVLAARTNYLIALADLMPELRRHLPQISLPVYLCDSVVPLDRPPDPELPLIEREGTVVFSTHDHDYVFPLSMKEQARIDLFCTEVDTAIRANTSIESFERRIRGLMKLSDRDAAQLVDVYRKIKQLDEANEDGIWARYIKNAFAPEYVGRFDFVVGNPPWIRWKFLSDRYRERTLDLWHKYGIFSLKGHAARLGGGEKDFSMLFTYASADRFLKDGGRLAFLITETVFKARGGGEGFRGFRLAHSGVPLKILFMEDMVQLNPFLTASNKTALVALQRGARTKYPVPVTHWRTKPGVGRIRPEWSYSEVLRRTEREKEIAVPVDPGRPESSWQTAPAAKFSAFRKMKGENPYVARRGADTAPYGVFRLRLREVRPNGIVVVESSTGQGDTRSVHSPVSIESLLLYPAVNGPEIVRFGVGDHFYIVLTQDHKTRKPLPLDWMETNAPNTLAYLRPFEEILLNRGSKPIAELARKTAFYAMFGIGEYSLAPYRVMWARTTNRIKAAVVSKVRTDFGTKEIIGCDHTTFVPLQNSGEAHYLCAVMNSRPVSEFLRAACPTAEVGPPSAIKPLAVPKFDPGNRVHRRLAELSEKAHECVRRKASIDDIDVEIDENVMRLWSIKH